MNTLKEYVGSIYGGLGHLLYTFYEKNDLPIPQKLADVQTQERFDYLIWRELLNELDQQFKEPALGLKIASLVEAKHLGILAYLFLSCENLGDAMMRYHDYHRLIFDGTKLRVEVQGEHLWIGWDALPYNLNTQITDEISIGLLMEFLKSVMELDDLHLHEVHFALPSSKHQAIYEHYFRCRVRFGQPQARVSLPVSQLAKPLRQGDQTLQLLLRQQAEALLDKLPNHDQFDQRLQQAILTGLQKNMFLIEHIARRMNTSVRQLQRHLQQQGTSYQQRMQEVRCMMATEYLKNINLSLQDIAMLLGYSEQSAFQRAFKQWTKLTPQQWRIQHSFAYSI